MKAHQDGGNVLRVDPTTKYDQAMAKHQRLEGWTLSSALLAAVGLTFLCFRIPNTAIEVPAWH
jgi:hypothetical protein